MVAIYRNLFWLTHAKKKKKRENSSKIDLGIAHWIKVRKDNRVSGRP